MEQLQNRILLKEGTQHVEIYKAGTISTGCPESIIVKIELIEPGYKKLL